MYRRIMLTSDGSELARVAAPHAGQLAALAGGAVVMVAVVPSLDEIELTGLPHGWVDLGGSLSDEQARDVLERSQDVATAHLRELRAELEEAGATVIEEHVLVGPAGPMIVWGTGDLDCDLVVMSTHGRSGLRRALMGSVADYVVTHSPRPVLVIPPAGGERGAPR